MSSIYIMIAFAALLTALVCYAFINQQLAKKRKQRLRLMHALNQRLDLFKHIAGGMPAGYLPPELNAFTHQILINTLEQLAKLAPKKNHSAEATEYQQRFEASKEVSERARLNATQAAQVQPLLQELSRYISTQAESGRLAKPQASRLLGLCRKLLLQSTIEGYVQQAKQAQTDNKLRLAIHHYSTARKLLLKEAGQQDVSKQVAQLSAVITKLEHEHAAQNQSTADDTDDAEANKKWNEFEDNGDDWKKKQIYD
ncbi:hypothetical protein [Gilvimarinus polysaccharolyticus]|uniref:hypothetical protein n=1 Tax=Gilvimarinus polysaccharolyticus TaxID=863921 RepID=UPI0006733B51|nr:hypothetical protein [Gilvimarinus polysaccharolyticus]